MSKIRRTYDAEFKRNAVMLVEEFGRTVADVAESLGIGKDMICRWCRGMKKQGQTAFPGQGKEGLTAEQRRTKNLKRSFGTLSLTGIYLKKHWPSSARHRNEILFHQGPPLAVFGEEDVPCAQGFQERILCMERPQALPAGRRDDAAPSSNVSTLRRAFRMCRQSHDHC